MTDKGKEIVKIEYDRKGRESSSGLAQSYLFGDRWVWLPKSQIELEEEAEVDSAMNLVHIPRWLAEKNDLEDFAQ